MTCATAIIEMLERGGWANIPSDEHALVTELIEDVLLEWSDRDPHFGSISIRRALS